MDLHFHAHFKCLETAVPILPFVFLKIIMYVCIVSQSHNCFSDLAAEQKRLTELYKDATDCIPVLLEDRESLPVSEIYAPLLIEEDLDAMKRTRRPDEPSGSKTLDSVQGVFYVGEKLSTRILIKGEAGSGKSVFCLKLVEIWCKLKQLVKREHVCEKYSEMVRQLEKDGELPWLLRQLCPSLMNPSLPDIPCTTCEMKQCLSQFDLLYYVSLRDAVDGKISVLDLICNAVCNDRQNLIDRTKQLLSNDNIRCLIVLDGVDEWPNPPGFTELPNTRGLSDNCVLLWTMRPWKLVHLQLKPKHDDHIVTVCGLSPYSVARVIENILVGFYGLNGEILKSVFFEYCQKVTDNTLAGIMRMPMMLIAACHLWNKQDVISSKNLSDSEQSFSKTHQYLSLLDIMIQNAAGKQSKLKRMNPTASLLIDRENNPPTHPGLPDILKVFDNVSHFIDMLLPFCKLAYTDLLSTETKLVFHKGQLERQLGKSHVDLVHRLGLISQVKVRSDIGCSQNVSVSFYHKSVQELLAAMYMTCENQDAVTSFCEYCSTFEKVMETANVTMFLIGVYPSLGCKMCEHITTIVNSDPDTIEYRRTLVYSGRIRQLYRTQCEWYRELTHSRTVTGDTSPLPSLYVSDICLSGNCDSDEVSLTADVMCCNLRTIVSVWLGKIRHPLHSVLWYLPQCHNLSALCIYMSNTEDNDMLVDVIPYLTQLTTVRYHGDYCDESLVAAVMTLTQLEWIDLLNVSLGDDGVELTDAMTRLRTVALHDVRMTAAAWDRFVTSLFTLPQTVCVRLHNTNIDEGTVKRIQTSPRLIVTRDGDSHYRTLEFTTVPSQDNK